MPGKRWPRAVAFVVLMSLSGCASYCKEHYPCPAQPATCCTPCAPQCCTPCAPAPAAYYPPQAAQGAPPAQQWQRQPAQACCQ